jgi:hypothetical protein
VTALKLVPSSTAPVSGSTAAEVGAWVPQIVSGAALAVVAVQMAALVAARVTAAASAKPALDARDLRACRTKLM